MLICLEIKKFIQRNSFGKDIYNGAITLKEVHKYQSSLLVEFGNFRENMKFQNSEKKQKEKDILKNLHTLFDGRERVFDAFESGVFPIKIEGTGLSDFRHSKLKILTSKQMLQRLPITPAQVKSGNTPSNHILFVSSKRNY